MSVYPRLISACFMAIFACSSLAWMGADAVGMSTVPEVIACAHAGIPVLGISCITNLAAGISQQPLSHDEVKQTADRVTGQFVALLRALVPALANALGADRA